MKGWKNVQVKIKHTCHCQKILLKKAYFNEHMLHIELTQNNKTAHLKGILWYLKVKFSFDY